MDAYYTYIYKLYIYIYPFLNLNNVCTSFRNPEGQKALGDGKIIELKGGCSSLRSSRILSAHCINESICVWRWSFSPLLFVLKKDRRISMFFRKETRYDDWIWWTCGNFWNLIIYLSKTKELKTSIFLYLSFKKKLPSGYLT